MRISTSEVLDSLHQMKLINPVDEQQFRSMLRSNFAKSMREVQHFDRLYHLFFHEMRIDTSDIRQAADYSTEINMTGDALKKIPHDNPIYDAVVDFLQGNPMALLREMRRIRTEEDVTMLRFNLGPLGNRLNVMLQINKAASAAKALVEDHYMETDSSAARELAAYFEERVNAARSMLVYEPQQGESGTRKIKMEEQKLKGLGEKSFSSFTRREVEEMREAIDKMVRKLKNIVSRRYAVRNREASISKNTARIGQIQRGSGGRQIPPPSETQKPHCHALRCVRFRLGGGAFHAESALRPAGLL